MKSDWYTDLLVKCLIQDQDKGLGERTVMLHELQLLIATESNYNDLVYSYLRVIELNYREMHNL